ncbi:MAG: 50S ribosomal protein L2 [Parcubacteria group bacterium GW2011_GWC1_38_6]|nr:MAG: 50S ribosomal protein L2 [Parcubacteria group bacterium GW2011_GWC1_38_6]
MKATKILTKKRPERKLITSLKKRGGRNSSGRITIRHRGGGAKRYYRVIDFGQGKINIPAKVIALEYDPNRTSFIALLEYQDKDRKYVIAPNGLKIGEEVIIAEKADLKTGNRMRLKNVSSGTEIFNIELEPDRGGKMIRGAGTSAQVLAQEGVYTHLKMPSGEVRKVRGECYATIGSVSYPEWRYVKLGKAGSSRHRGRRPAVRGVAMAQADEVVDIGVIQDGKGDVLIVSENGFGKRTDLSQYRKQKRGGAGIKAMQVTAKTGPLVGGHILIGKEEELIVVSIKGQVIRTPLSTIPKRARTTQGVRLMKLVPGDKIASFVIL